MGLQQLQTEATKPSPMELFWALMLEAHKTQASLKRKPSKDFSHSKIKNSMAEVGTAVIRGENKFGRIDEISRFKFQLLVWFGFD